MSLEFPFFTGQARQPPASAQTVPVPDRSRYTDPAGYLTDGDLVAAVNVALLLGQPLLLTGEAGTGKTQLAHRLAWELALGEPLEFHTKSTSTARDLFYSFDAVRRFQAKQTETGSSNVLDYITFNALGVAILLACGDEIARKYLPARQLGGNSRRVVLIDEVDKAPRDFPNDLLHEIDNMSFRVPELVDRDFDGEFKASTQDRPIVVMTSNSEKNLPDAFLRRCVFYHIQFPGKNQLLAILQSRLPSLKDSSPKLRDDAVDTLEKIRKQPLRKPPATAELINWVQALERHGAQRDASVQANRTALRASLPALAKTREDFDSLLQFFGFSRESATGG